MKSNQEMYYIVLKPFFFDKKKLTTDEGIDWIFKAVPGCIKNSVTVYTNREDAKMDASQFSAREVPDVARDEPYRTTHLLVKPILCLPLNHSPIPPAKKSQSIFTEGPAQISYYIPTRNLQQWQECDWTLLIGDDGFKQPEKSMGINLTIS